MERNYVEGWGIEPRMVPPPAHGVERKRERDAIVRDRERERVEVREGK